MYEALRIWNRDHVERLQRLTKLRDDFERELSAQCDGVVINGEMANRLPHTSNVAFPGVDRQALVMALDMAGIACSTGSACASGSSEPSPVLLAMRLDQTIVDSSIRFSFSALTTETEVVQAAQRISRIVNDLRRCRKSDSSLPTPPKTAIAPV